MVDMTSALRTQHYDQPAMDKAHQRFTAILGALPLASSAAAPALLDSLYQEAVEHFDQEERFMQVIDYEDYAGHRQQHQYFLTLLSDYQAAIRSEQAPDMQQIHSALCQWQDDHQQAWDEPLATVLNYGASWTPTKE